MLVAGSSPKTLGDASRRTFDSTFVESTSVWCQHRNCEFRPSEWESASTYCLLRVLQIYGGYGQRFKFSGMSGRDDPLMGTRVGKFA
jgi:hypothetical protein